MTLALGLEKTVDHNLDLIAGIPTLREYGRPVLMGISRKAFLQHLTNRPVQDRLTGSMAVHAICVIRGANILRVHDVEETCDVIAIADTLKKRWSFLST